MEDLLAHVRCYASRHGLLQSSKTVVVGVSGGPDSLALLHLLRRLSQESDLSLHVAHLNHGLRGAAADEDARFVADLAARWGLPCTLGQADVRSSAGGCSIEEAARLARYRFLAETAAEADAGILAVGHNADDQAETVLMHLLRGAGVAGLRGMLPRTPLADYRLGLPLATQVSLERPLLSVPRRDVEAYCSAHGLKPRFDRSNEDLTLYRNRLRHELLPLLEGYNPAIRNLLAHTATVMAGEAEILQAGLDTAWQQVTLPAGPNEVLLDLSKWRALQLGLQRSTLREAIRILRRELRDINGPHVERAVWLAREGGTGQSATLSNGLTLQIGYHSLRISAEGEPWRTQAPLIAGDVVLQVPGETLLAGGWRVIVRAEQPGAIAGVGKGWEARLDAQAVGRRLRLRPRRPGDRFQPQGLGGHSVKLNEFMIDRKVCRDDRAGWPLLEGESGLAWICGLRVDERAAVRADTQAVWRVMFVQDSHAGGAVGA